VALFIPECLLLLKRLLGDPRVPRRRKAVGALAVAYLAIPFDLIPDFIPVVGLLDDAIVVGLALRVLLRGSDAAVLREHWRGPDSSLALIRRLAYGPGA
jgi:uncharacterized membrane protein YkvA (DUF1232 family)